MYAYLACMHLLPGCWKLSNASCLLMKARSLYILTSLLLLINDKPALVHFNARRLYCENILWKWMQSEVRATGSFFFCSEVHVNLLQGEIFLKPGASLDREMMSTYTFQVTAYDSPLDPSVRLSTTAPVRTSKAPPVPHSFYCQWQLLAKGL